MGAARGTHGSKLVVLVECLRAVYRLYLFDVQNTVLLCVLLQPFAVLCFSATSHG